MFRSIYLLLIVFLFCCCGASPAKKQAEPHQPPSPRESTPENPNAAVVGVSDGDTLTVRMESGNQERIRLATIDAPETGQPYSQASKKSLSDLVFGKQVRVEEIGRDRYGRMVGEVRLGGLNVNVEQIRRGFAWHYKAYEHQQSAEQRRVYSFAEETARAAKVGLWRDQNPVPPWAWRKQKTGRSAAAGAQ